MNWGTVAISVSASVSVSVFLFAWLKMDIHRVENRLSSEIKELRDMFIKYIAKEKV